MSKPSDYQPWLEQFQTADDAAWSAWKEVQTLTARVAELEKSEIELCAQRDHAEEWADKLAEAIAAHFREDIGEHSNLNNPWAHAHNLIDGTFCR